MNKAAPYDSAEFPSTPRAIQHYIEEALETGDPGLITHAIGIIAKSQSMSVIARKTGMSRENLYRTLTPNGKPGFATVLKVVNALGLRFSVLRQPVASKVRTAKKAVSTKGQAKPSPRRRTSHQHTAKRREQA